MLIACHENPQNMKEEVRVHFFLYFQVGLEYFGHKVFDILHPGNNFFNQVGLLHNDAVHLIAVLDNSD